MSPFDGPAKRHHTPINYALDLREGDIPETALRAAALVLLDTLGVAAASSTTEAANVARRAARGLYNTQDPSLTARILFDGRTASLPGAAYAGAAMIDNLDAHDGYNPTKGHIGVVAVPSMFACAEVQEDIAGRDALAALTLCYEFAGRAGIALHATVADYHTSGAWNALGVAAMGTRLRGQTPTVLREALGIAEYHGPRSQMMREIANPTMLHDGSGQGALVGLSSLLMAEMGMTGAPAITVEAPEVADIWADLGAFWQVEHQYIKPYPICRWAHAAIDAAREMSQRHEIDADEIAGIEIRSFVNAVELFPGMPQTTSQAQYSLPFAVGVMLVHGDVGVRHISGAGLRDPRVEALVDKTTMIAADRHERRYPEARWSDVVIRMTDGREVASGDVHARGGPERPFTEGDIVAKFMAYAAPVLGEARAAAIRDATLGLTAPDAQLSDLTSLVYAAPDRAAP